MSPGRVQDPKVAKSITISCNSPAGAIAAIIKRRFLITCYTKHDTCRLRLDSALTARIIARSGIGTKKICIYDSHIHHLSDLDPTNCGPDTTPKDICTWVVNTLKAMEQYTAVAIPDQEK